MEAAAAEGSCERIPDKASVHHTRRPHTTTARHTARTVIMHAL